MYIEGEYKYIGFVQNMVKALSKKNEIIIYISNIDLVHRTLNSFILTAVKTW